MRPKQYAVGTHFSREYSYDDHSEAYKSYSLTSGGRLGSNTQRHLKLQRVFGVRCVEILWGLQVPGPNLSRGLCPSLQVPIEHRIIGL